MLDINFVKENIDLIKKTCLNKNIKVDLDRLLYLREKLLIINEKIEALNARRNTLARATQGGKPTEAQITEGKKIKEEISSIMEGERVNELEGEYAMLMNELPNIPTEDTPVGNDETGNKIIGEFGQPKKFDFPPKEHWQLGSDLGVIDTDSSAAISGSRFAYLLGDIAKMEFAIIKYLIDTLTDREKIKKIIAEYGLKVSDTPFIPVIPPVIVRPEVMSRMARLEPKDERYHLDQDDMYLVGSAEHSLGPLFMDKTVSVEKLPIRYLGYSPAFRREAGAYGKDIKGIIRLHQFNKCEMESFSTPEHSFNEHKFMVAIQENFMRSLEIPYQLVLKCTGDMGTPDARAVDIEAWFPGQNKYRETHTADYMTDYQSRRLKSRFKTKEGGVGFMHMNDATASADRTIAAIMENYQEADGSVRVPTVLQPYMNGINKLSAVK